jgi:sigma-B regulation protein RsbU (phosphoserine phosphatase)
MMVSLISIRRTTMESGNQIGSTVAENSAESLRNQAMVDIEELIQAKSSIIEQNIQEAIEGVAFLKGYIERLYSSRDEFRLIRIPNYRDVERGQVQIHWVLDAGIVPNPRFNEDDLIRAGVREETYLLGNLDLINYLIMHNIPDVFTIYLSTKSGQNIQYDADAALKVDLPPRVIHERPWYTAARDSGTLYVSEAYQDIAGRGLTISIASPYYGGSGEFMGVVGIDLGIANLDNNIKETVVGTSGYALLLNNNAGEDRNQTRIISASNLNEEIENNIAAYLGDDTEKILTDMKNTPNGVGRSVIMTGNEATEVYVIWASVYQWHLVYVVPENDILAPSIALHNEIIKMTADSTKSVNTLIYAAIIISGLLLVAIILLTLRAAGLIASRIARPITILTEGVKKINNGNLEYHSEIKTGDEIEELSISFERMGRELMTYIENLNSVTAEKERIGAELNIATKIQASMLPRIFPAFPDREEFDVYASMLPAKEVGGDFYDFFLIEKNILAIVIADVSGKGVPAALFMVIAKTLIKNNAQYGLSPKDVFSMVNNLLCANNEEGMFVTAFMGFLDILTGTFTCVNAGHNPPLIKRGDHFEWLKIKRGLFLGGMENVSYKQEELELKNGDMVYLYTDGVTEAMNPERELFAESRLLKVADLYKDCGLKEFSVSIKDKIDEFTEDAEQADDITMLVLKYKGIQ